MFQTYFHPDTKRQLDAIVADLPHALLLTGPLGIGLSAVVEYISKVVNAPVSTVLPEKNEKIDIEKGVISVDSVRRLYDTTKTKSTSPRLIAIDYAERMGTQAQNAFLKLLEEPPAHTHFLLLTHDPSTLLPTIRSRSQRLNIRNITKDQSQTLLNELKVTDTTKRQQLLFIAEGLPAELSRLATDDQAFEKRASIIRDARSYIQGNPYQVMKLSQQYKDNREQALLLVNDAMRLLKASFAREADPRILRRLETLLEIYERLRGNGNIRLQLAVSVV